MTGRVIRVPVAALALATAVLVATNTGAFAYTSGSIGYDVSYLQCGQYAAAARPLSVATVRTSTTIKTSRPAALPLRQAVAAPQFTAQATSSRSPWWSQPRNATPPSSSIRIWYRFTWGIVGVDSGRPFMSAASPGNPCLASEYRHAASPGLYVNTGYDPSYTDTNHTTASCKSQSLALTVGTDAQKAAWAVGCSEAQGDYGYTTSQGITSAQAWWLDVETINSWCSPTGPNCTDLSLNQYTIQGLIDTFTNIGAVPVGIYSNNYSWTTIMGTPNFHPTGATMDWYASPTTTAQTAKAYCNNIYSFSGAPVTIVQFQPDPSTDRDYAC